MGAVRDSGTTLVLEHSGFDSESFAFTAMGQGWRGEIALRIKDVIAKLV